MKKSFIIFMTAILILGLAGSVMAANSNLVIVGDGENATEFSTGRTTEEYVNELIDLVDADEAGDIIYPDENEYRYLFVPLYKDGELLGYGTWVNTVIYQHPEDFIAVVAPDASILKWKPLDANDHHPEMREEEYLSRYYGMTLDSTFDPAADVISGSTISCNTFYFEMRNILLTAVGFGPLAEEE
jgi:hypothetical protein